MDDFEREQYEYAAALGKCDNAEERQKIVDRIGVLLKYRGSMAQQLLDLEGGDDEELVNLLKVNVGIVISISLSTCEQI